VIDRANRARWLEEGGATLGERAHAEVLKHLDAYEPTRVPESARRELVELMTAAAERHGMDTLPARDA
jgi:trimethylamine:corrinoid methyltransferase-like protein